jgi:hypothetical protein
MQNVNSQFEQLKQEMMNNFFTKQNQTMHQMSHQGSQEKD